MRQLGNRRPIARPDSAPRNPVGLLKIVSEEQLDDFSHLAAQSLMSSTTEEEFIIVSKDPLNTAGLAGDS